MLVLSHLLIYMVALLQVRSRSQLRSRSRSTSRPTSTAGVVSVQSSEARSSRRSDIILDPAGIRSTSERKTKMRRRTKIPPSVFRGRGAVNQSVFRLIRSNIDPK